MPDPNEITFQIRLPIDVETAWCCWADPHHLKNWFGDHVQLEVTLGGTFRETWTNDGRPVITSGQVVLCNPPLELAWTWADDDWPESTQLNLAFQGVGEETMLTLRHSGWIALGTDLCNPLREAHKAGWTMHLSSLSDHCQTLPSA